MTKRDAGIADWCGVGAPADGANIYEEEGNGGPGMQLDSQSAGSVTAHGVMTGIVHSSLPLYDDQAEEDPLGLGFGLE